MYRGSEYPGLVGKYFYADYCTGKIWTLERLNDEMVQNTEVFQGPSSSYSTFGEDNNGELYIARLNGEVARIVSTSVSSIKNEFDGMTLKVLSNPFINQLSFSVNNGPNGYTRVRLLDVAGKSHYDS